MSSSPTEPAPARQSIQFVPIPNAKSDPPLTSAAGIPASGTRSKPRPDSTQLGMVLWIALAILVLWVRARTKAIASQPTPTLGNRDTADPASR